jgi:hypothetical protein
VTWWEWALLAAWGPSTVAAVVLAVCLLPISIAGRVSDRHRSGASARPPALIDVTDAAAAADTQPIASQP